MPSSFQTHSPIDNRLLFTREYASQESIDGILDQAKQSQKQWRDTPLSTRITKIQSFVDAVIAETDVLAQELTEQMGRPIRYSAGEIRGFEQRAKTMLKMAPQALADLVPV